MEPVTMTRTAHQAALLRTLEQAIDAYVELCSDHLLLCDEPPARDLLAAFQRVTFHVYALRGCEEPPSGHLRIRGTRPATPL